MPQEFPPSPSLILPVLDALRAEILAAVTTADPSEEHTVAACKAAVESTVQEYLFSPEQSLNRQHARRHETSHEVMPRLVSRALRKLMTQIIVDDATAKAALGDLSPIINSALATLDDEPDLRVEIKRLADIERSGLGHAMGGLRDPTEDDA